MTEITANYDESWKEAINEYFEAFLLFFFSNIHASINWEKTPIPLEQELARITAASETEKRHADKLFKVWLLDNQEVWILIHLEIQSQYEKVFPQRMFIYNYRSYDLYQKPVISLAILGDGSNSWRPTSFEYGLGDNQMRLNFSIIKLLDYQWEELEQSKNPFAVVVMAHLKTKSTTNDFEERKKWKWQLVRNLYEKGWRRLEIVNLFKFIDTMMTLPSELQKSFNQTLNEYEEERKMPFLSTMEKMAIERGKESGAKENCQKNICQILEKRFGKLSKDLVKQINQIEELNVLEQLHLETISVNSVADFQTLIEPHLKSEN